MFELGDDGLNVFDGNGVHAREGLIQQDELRVNGQGAGDFGAASLPTRQHHAHVLAHVFQAEFLDKFFDLIPLRLPRHIRHLQHGLDVFFDGQLPEYGGFLRQITQTQPRSLVHRKARDVAIVEIDVAAVRLHQTDRHVERSRFSRSVGTQQAHDFALLYLVADVVVDESGAVFFDKIFGS